MTSSSEHVPLSSGTVPQVPSRGHVVPCTVRLIAGGVRQQLFEATFRLVNYPDHCLVRCPVHHCPVHPCPVHQCPAQCPVHRCSAHCPVHCSMPCPRIEPTPLDAAFTVSCLVACGPRVIVPIGRHEGGPHRTLQGAR